MDQHKFVREFLFLNKFTLVTKKMFVSDIYYRLKCIFGVKGIILNCRPHWK